MPNHVTTIINAPEEVIEALLSHESIPDRDYSWLKESEEADKYIADDRAKRKAMIEAGYVDFNKLIPQPDNIEKGSCSGEHPPGVICWYTWSIENWGTKWNAYDTEVRSPTELKFETAWSHPFSVLEVLSARFPDAIIEVRFADEDIGQNLGHYRITDGDANWVQEFEFGSDEANEFAAQVKYGMTYAALSAEWED